MKRLRKIPIQIYLEPEQEKIIDLLSKTSGKSKAAIIRSCISQFIANLPIANLPPEKDPALNIIGIGDSGKGDIAQRHDDYLIAFQNL